MGKKLAKKAIKLQKNFLYFPLFFSYSTFSLNKEKKIKRKKKKKFRKKKKEILQISWN